MNELMSNMVLRVASASKKRMYANMLDVGRDGRYIKSLKNSSEFKTFAIWKK